MADSTSSIPPNPMYEAAFARQRRWQRIRQWIRRTGCLVIFLAWVVLMAFPCTLVTLLVNREMTFQRSDLPDHQTRLFLLQEPDERGFGIENGRIVSGGEDEGQYCIVTSITYLLWEGEGDNVSYCNCYERQEEIWNSTLVGGDENCQPLPLDAATPAADEG